MSTEKLGLSVALERVDGLNDHQLPLEQPSIQALSSSVEYQPNFDTNFEDQNAFVSSVAKYKEQAKIQANLNLLLEEGREYAVLLYTWRSCSRAIPQTIPDDKRKETYEAVAEILEPNVKKLMDFMYFQERARDLFCNEVSKLCHKEQKADFVSEAYLLTLGKLINMFAELDELKNMKASMRNDYASYRRANQYIQTALDGKGMEDSQKLSMNLATQNVICDTLKSKLVKIKGYEELLADVVNICVMMFEKSMYVEPKEKYMLVKVMALGLFLIDTADKNTNIYQMNEKKKISLSKIDHILKQTQIVPLYGDMMIAPYNYIKNSPNYDSSKWPNCESNKPSPQANFLACIPAIRETHMEYISILTRRSNELAKLSRETPRTKEENKELTELALRGLKLLSGWTQSLMELYSWKLLNPTKDCPETAEEYERATRYNYTKEEKYALVEVIAMIKGLQLLMSRMENIFEDAICCHVYSELQQFVQKFLRGPIRKAIKHKNDILRAILLSVRESCADWLEGDEPKKDPALMGKKDPPEGFFINLHQRNVGPSSTQLYMVRTMLESLIDERAGVKKSRRKELNEQHVVVIEDFHRKTFLWPYLLNFSQTLFHCCDLSQLWFREFFLELTMGKRIQFPIEMSMPWILTDFILETKEPSMMEYVLYPLDLYNDCAQYALMIFKKQFLYDEVEAEVNLCYDQFVFKLSNQIFAYYKHLAGSIMLDKKFRAEVTNSQNKVNYPIANRYETLLKQRHMQLLGRSIDLNQLISPLINVALQKALDHAILRFEAADITGIVELEGLIEVNRLAHKLMGKYLLLNDFDAMLKEANNNVNSAHGRITLHIFWEINTELLPNYCYNSTTNRFVRTVLPLGSESKREKAPGIASHYVWGSKRLNQSFSTIYSLYSNFIGPPHFRAMCRLLDHIGIAIIAEELLNLMNTILSGTITQYVTTMMNVMPKSIKLPRFDYGSPGILQFYEAHMADVLQYPELKTEVFQNFTEIGNSLLFCLMLEQTMAEEEVLKKNQAAIFLNQIPRPHIPKKDGEDYQAKVKQTMEGLRERYSALYVSKVFQKCGTEEQSKVVNEGEPLTANGIISGRSLFGEVLKRMASFIDKPLWHGEPPCNGVMNVEGCTEFHRLWSAMQFLFCIPLKATEFTIEQMFGDGLNWAGCTLIAVLGQQQRFELLDFSYHLLKINRVDMKNETVAGIELKKMVDRIRKFQILNSEIFSCLSKYMNAPDDNKTFEQICHFEPPVFEPNAKKISEVESTSVSVI